MAGIPSEAGGTVRRFAAILALLVGVFVLWALFLPAANPGSHRFLLDPRPQAGALLLLAGLAGLTLAGRRLPVLARWLLAGLIVATALLQLVDALVWRFLDRGLDLYFDLRHVPSLLGLAADAAGPWRVGGAVAAVLLGSIAATAAVAWSLGAVERTLAPRCHALLGLGAAIAVLALGLLPTGKAPAPVSGRSLATVGRQVAQVWRAWAVTHGIDTRYAAALAVPQPPLGALPGLKRRDVYLVFFESYGTVVLDDPRFRAVVAPALAAFEATTAKAGYHLVSSRLVSPTFGGGSWLAHGTIASGLKLDPLLTRLIVESGRRTLARYMEAAGYRAVNVMPGIKKPWPEARFWGFDRDYFAADLGYHGLAFGWFGIPDQYTLRTFAERELQAGHGPLFAQLVLVSSHTPFVPVPPYVADWADAASFKTVPQAEWEHVYRQPDWAHLDEPYLDSVVYDLRTLAAWLARLDGNPLVIIMGDHQPPGFVSGEKQPWTVPVHVLSRDAALLQPFRALGYVAGAVPPRDGPFKGMESFLSDFLAAFARPPAVVAGHAPAPERAAN